MFNYIREIIINKRLVDINRSAGNKIVLEGVGEYDKRNVTKVWVTRGTEGTAGTFTIDCATLAGAAEGATVYNVQMFVKTVDKYLVDYANANWGAFGKAVTVEFSAAKNGAEIATNMKKAIEEAVKDLDPMFTLEITGLNKDQVKGTFVEKYFAIGEDNVVLSVYNTAGELVEVDGAVLTNETVAPFATADWLVENLRFPSYPNVRYAAKNSDEYPVAGQVYDQVSFQYAVERPGLGGLSAVGQKVESVTTHVLYIKRSDADALAALFGTPDVAATPDMNGETDYGYDDITNPEEDGE